jgi:hypothetical protein
METPGSPKVPSGGGAARRVHVEGTAHGRARGGERGGGGPGASSAAAASQSPPAESEQRRAVAIIRKLMIARICNAAV